ncbi:MAG TPA: hypothetical protein VLV15_14945, partial [Dongiaceae bacterium]|nr:hypothetical protein [Dongiaceae bacterium]
LRRAGALDAGLKALHERGYVPDLKWKTMVTTDADGIQSVFVWRALGREVYHMLIGKDLAPPHWEVRLASFRGDVAERAEEWQAWITGDRASWRVRHVLPDGRNGASLDETPARTLAHDELRHRFHMDPAVLKEVSAVSAKHPARLDWTFTFADTAPPRLKQGERRIAVEVSGDRVSDAYRFVFVPEDWQRKYRGENAQLRVLTLIRVMVVAVVFILSAAFGIVAWTRRTFPVGFAMRFFALMTVLNVVGAINRWPEIEAGFSTAQPYDLQLGINIIGRTLGLLVVGAVFALIAGWCQSELPSSGQPRAPLGIALAVGATAAGFMVAIGRLSTASGPLLGDFSSAQALAPWGDQAVAAGVDLLRRATGLLAVITLARSIGAGGARVRPLVVALLFVVGGLVAMPPGAASPASWFALVALTG